LVLQNQSFFCPFLRLKPGVSAAFLRGHCAEKKRRFSKLDLQIDVHARANRLLCFDVRLFP
jgi:hypothetical protein